jgi:hypothetical protein
MLRFIYPPQRPTPAFSLSESAFESGRIRVVFTLFHCRSRKALSILLSTFPFMGTMVGHGISAQWRTARIDIPKEVGKDEFERWLWMEETAEVSQYVDLRNETAFPPFDDLPEESAISPEFYESIDGFSYHPRKHWGFLSEIIDVEKFGRLWLRLRRNNDIASRRGGYLPLLGGESL